MYERFTDRSRKVMILANQEAQRFNHEYIGTEHILLGLVKEGSGVAANVLKNLDVDLRKIRLEVEKIVEPVHLEDGAVIMGRLPHTPHAKLVTEYAVEEARSLLHDYVGTEHLLMGLTRVEGSVAHRVLTGLGVSFQTIREEVLNLLGLNPDGSKVSRDGSDPSVTVVSEQDVRFEYEVWINKEGTEARVSGEAATPRRPVSEIREVLVRDDFARTALLAVLEHLDKTPEAAARKTNEGKPLLDTITVPEESDPVAGEVWYDPTDCREQDPFRPVARKRYKVLEVRGEWLQYEFNSGSDGGTPVVSSTKVAVFKRMYRRQK